MLSVGIIIYINYFNYILTLLHSVFLFNSKPLCRASVSIPFNYTIFVFSLFIHCNILMYIHTYYAPELLEIDYSHSICRISK